MLVAGPIRIGTAVLGDTAGASSVRWLVQNSRRRQSHRPEGLKRLGAVESSTRQMTLCRKIGSWSTDLERPRSGTCLPYAPSAPNVV